MRDHGAVRVDAGKSWLEKQAAQRRHLSNMPRSAAASEQEAHNYTHARAAEDGNGAERRAPRHAQVRSAEAHPTQNSTAATAASGGISKRTAAARPARRKGEST